jgi:hypothetical protein
MDFKPRVVFGTFINQLVDLCFYDYSKHHDIRCYDKDGVVVPDEIVTKAFDRYFGDYDLTYSIQKEYYSEMGYIWVCRAWAEAKCLLCFVGYSEFSAAHAIEDLENAKKLILGRYYKPNDNKPENINE